MRLPTSTFGKILAGAAVVIVASTGTAYAVATVTSGDIVDGTIRSIDVHNATLTTADIKNATITDDDVANSSLTTLDILNGTLTSADVADETLTTDDILNGTLTSADVADGTLTSADVADGTLTGTDVTNESLTSADLGTDSVTATEVANNSIDSGEIVDFGLTNEDVGVLGAEVNADGTLAATNHSGTTSTPIGVGTYEVDFGLAVTSCIPVATQGEAGVGGAAGAVVGVTDRSGNAEAYFVTTRNAAGVLANSSFHLITVC